MNKTCSKVIVIDDDPSNNLIFKIVLKRLCQPLQTDVTDFILPAEGVTFLSDLLLTSDTDIILFLDINMPVLTGWDVLDKLSLLPDFAKQKLTIFIVSSSIDISDEKRAVKHPMVERFLPKPVTVDMTWLKELLTENVCI